MYPTPLMSPVPVAPTQSGMAIASMVLGITGVLLSWCLFGIPSIVAVVLGHISMRETGPGGTRTGRGMALAGLILGYVVIGIIVISVIVSIARGSLSGAVYRY